MASRGISPEAAQAQLDRFQTGFPYLEIADAARPGEGIEVLDEQQQAAAVARWEQFLADGGRVTKFVPASGAASRMFKALFEFANGDTDTAPADTPVGKLLPHIHEMAFSSDLDQALQRLHSMSLAEMVKAGRNRDIIRAIVNPEGLNYGALPKALLKFHTYADGARTPLEEQLTEGAQTAANSRGEVSLHFTVSSHHRPLFEAKLKEAVPATEARFPGLKFDVSLSEQKPSTDTLAANPDNTPFLEDDNLFFRPGGHGALIENLNDIDSEVVFIKNIDNVVPDHHRDSTIQYKKVLAGRLLQVHDEIVAALADLRAGADPGRLAEIADFMEQELQIRDERLETPDAEWMAAKLDRPLRVAGMVKNEGEPGGGPYIARNPDGSYSPQVLESTQIAPEYAEMMASATHFNPVDLVCYLKRPDGTSYELPKYVDPATGFISSKSSHGRELRAMELPGLWNGAMSDWNTVFVEVPVSTFNPVKTVNDLMRPTHC